MMLLTRTYHVAWAATCRNNDWTRSIGMERLVKSRNYRQDIVAGGLGDHLVQGKCGVAVSILS